MSKLDISKNQLSAPGCKALAEALGSSSITDLNIANSQLTLKADAKKLGDTDFSGLIQLADVLKDNGALASMTFGDKKAVTINTTMTEADFSGAKLGVSGAIILAAWLKHK